MRPPAATGYVSPNDIRIAGSIGNRNFPTPLLLTSIALPSSPSLFFTAAAAFLPRSCARNYNKCRARNTRTEKYHSSRKWSNGVPFSFFFFFFRQRIFALERISTPVCIRLHALHRVPCSSRNSRSCSTRSRDRERKREREINSETRINRRRRGRRGCESA